MNNEELADKIAKDIEPYSGWSAQFEVKRIIKRDLDDADTHLKRLMREEESGRGR